MSAPRGLAPREGLGFVLVKMGRAGPPFEPRRRQASLGTPVPRTPTGPPCCTLFTFVTCCSLQIILSQNYLLPLISVLAENTLLKTAYHFLLLLVGFDTLTYRKDYDRSPILVGHQDSFLAPLPGSEAPLVGGIW